MKISEYCKHLILQAFDKYASDILFEPYKGYVQISFKVDGSFIEIDSIDPKKSQRVFTAYKVMGDLQSYRSDIIQEGRIKLDEDDQTFNVRLSFVPTINGERLSIRLFNFNRDLLNLNKLNLDSQTIDFLTRALNHPNGTILLTGPPSSGKTTTIYAMLKYLKQINSDISISTIEDPVEHNLEGEITQIEVNPYKELTFDNILKSLLRQDLKCIMVGEIRSSETAQIAIRAGLTGHLIISTIHTKDITDVIPRLLDLGVDPYFISGSLNLITSIRLIRKICNNCKEEVKIGTEFQKEFPEVPEFQMIGKGCEQCFQTGYKGRVPITEVLRIDGNLEAKIQKLSRNELKQELNKIKVGSFQDKGFEMVKNGLTTIKELQNQIRLTGGSYEE